MPGRGKKCSAVQKMPLPKPFFEQLSFSSFTNLSFFKGQR
jgi:hypothetical protein